MEAKSKLTKELVAQESRFILDCLLNATKFSPQVPIEELRRLCEQSVSLRLADYLGFLERFGYLTHEKATNSINITADGQRVVAGEKIAELVIDVVHHFRPLLSKARRDEPSGAGTTGSSGGSPSPSGSTPSVRVPGRMPGGRRPLTRDLVDDRYEKIRVIGSGGIGSVYLARQVHLDRNVAFKEVRELFAFFTEPQRIEIGRRFEEEVRKASRLLHPNIAVILDANTGRDQPYFVSEFITGGNLRRILKYAEVIPPELSVKIFLQVLHALGHAHVKGVVHRGLKPENILFDATGNVRITDFGVARAVERDEAVIQHVYVGMGSVGYMAPELFTDPGSVGPSTDLYSLGVILYEMLSRKLPGRRSPMPTKLHPTLPKVIDDLFDRLTQDDRNDRYRSVDEVLGDFHKADASKAFLEPRGAVLFLESPLDKLVVKEPEGEKSWRALEREEAPSPALAPAAAPAATASKGAVEGGSIASSPDESDTELRRAAEASARAEAPASVSSAVLDALKLDSPGFSTGSGPNAGEAEDPSAPLLGTESILERDLAAQIAEIVGPASLSSALLGAARVPGSPSDSDALELDGAEPLSAEALEDGDSLDDGDKPRRRSGVYRPYSFQQRKKEREK
jgi:eukaryotic-like serine/threonine-protein kinase